jgi:hypothetical protein
MALQFFVGSLSPFQFLNPTQSQDPMIGGTAPRKAATYTQNNTNTELTNTESMPRVGFEPTIPVLDRAKTVNALDLAATVINR